MIILRGYKLLADVIAGVELIELIQQTGDPEQATA